MATSEFGTGKTVLVLAIVAGCFAVLWPKLIYPMLQSAINVKAPADTSSGCCEVLSFTDVDAVKLMGEMCSGILRRRDALDPGGLTPALAETCRNQVLATCGIDLAMLIGDRVHLGKTYKRRLDELRGSLNGSACLQRSFNVDLARLGAPHRMRTRSVYQPRHHRQERPPHLRPDLLNSHPALQERGRTIPVTPVPPATPRIIEKEGRPPGPIPGMRPPMGGAGHVVPAPKTAGTGTMGIIMPLYTIGIVVFFAYTMIKMVFKRPGVAGEAAAVRPDFHPDPVFRRMVFEEPEEPVRVTPAPPAVNVTATTDNGTKLGWKERDTRDAEMDQLRRRLEETQAAMQKIVASMGSVAGPQLEQEVQKAVAQEIKAAVFEREAVQEIEKVVEQDKEAALVAEIEKAVSGAGSGEVKVVGMETTASVEGGRQWSRPQTPLTPVPLSSNSRSSTPLPPAATPVSIFLEGALPAQSQLLVSDYEVESTPAADEDDAPVVLSGKMTLSLISLEPRDAVQVLREPTEAPQAAPPAEDTQSSANFTTATSAAAQGSGAEETAADFSAIDDDMEAEDLDDEEVWNGDVDSESEDEHAAAT